MKSGILLLVLFLLVVFVTCAIQDGEVTDESKLIKTSETTHVTNQEHYKVEERKLLDVFLKVKLTKLPDHQDGTSVLVGKEEDHAGHAYSDILHSKPIEASSEIKSPKSDKHRAQRKKVSRARKLLKSAMDSLVMLNMDYNHHAHHRPPINNGKPPALIDDRF